MESELYRLFNQKKHYNNHWLGVHQIGFGVNYAKYGNAKLPTWMTETREFLMPMLDQFRSRYQVAPNTLYIQYLDAGEAVKPHRDPLTDLYGTGILWIGNFTGGDLLVETAAGIERINSHHQGQAWLPCTVNGKQGPRHWSDPVLSGRRWSLILNYSVK